MKRLLLHTTVFISIFILLAIATLLVLNFTVERAYTLNVPKHKKILILGHSQSQAAYNDSIIYRAVNFSDAGEAYFYTYSKLKQILDKNPQIDTVLVEFTNNQLFTKMDGKIWENKYMTNRFPLLSPFQDTEQYLILLKKNPVGFIKSFSIALRENANRCINRNFDFTHDMGGYEAKDTTLADSFFENADFDPEPIASHSEPDFYKSYTFKYLEKIIDLCEAAGKHVCLIRSPQHPVYIGLQNEEILQAVLKNRFSEITFLDFNDFPLENKDYRDHKHLNKSGSLKFSTWLNSEMHQGLFSNGQPSIGFSPRVHLPNHY